MLHEEVQDPADEESDSRDQHDFEERQHRLFLATELFLLRLRLLLSEPSLGGEGREQLLHHLLLRHVVGGGTVDEEGDRARDAEGLHDPDPRQTEDRYHEPSPQLAQDESSGDRVEEDAHPQRERERNQHEQHDDHNGQDCHGALPFL